MWGRGVVDVLEGQAQCVVQELGGEWYDGFVGGRCEEVVDVVDEGNQVRAVGGVMGFLGMGVSFGGA